jgi:hypothetical protein
MKNCYRCLKANIKNYEMNIVFPLNSKEACFLKIKLLLFIHILQTSLLRRVTHEENYYSRKKMKEKSKHIE